MDKDQLERYSKKEMELIKQVFGNVELLRSLQKVFLQTPLNAIDLSQLQLNITGKAQVHHILRRMFLPQLTDDVPYQQVWDLTGAINFKEKMHEDIVLHIKSNDLVIKYYDQQLKLIEKGKYQVRNPKINYRSLGNIKDLTDNDIFVNILTRNSILGTTKGRLENLYQLAMRVEETPEQKAEKARLNSSK